MKTTMLLVIALMGCSSAIDWKAPTSDWKTMSLDQRQATLNMVADGCKLARSAFEFRSADELRFHPDPASSYESVDCALGRVKQLRGFGKMGFVGNEAYVEEKK